MRQIAVVSLGSDLRNVTGIRCEEPGFTQAWRIIRLLAIGVVLLFVSTMSAWAEDIARDNAKTTMNKLIEQGRYREAEPLGLQLIEEPPIAASDYPDLLDQVALVQEAMGNYPKAQSLYLKSLELRSKAIGELDPRLATSLSNLAALHLHQGHPELAQPYAERANSLLEQDAREHGTAYIRGLLRLAVVERGLGNKSRSTIIYQQALLALTQATNADLRLRVDARLAYADFLITTRDFATANSQIQIARTLLSEHDPEHQLMLADVNMSNATVLYAQGELKAAEKLYREALAQRGKVLGENHPDIATSQVALAQALYLEGEYGEAEQLHRRALEIREQSFGKDHPSIAQSLSSLAILARNQGDFSTAEQFLKRALAINVHTYGEINAEVAQCRNSLALLYYSNGQFDRSEVEFKTALKIRESLFAGDHPALAQSLNGLAVLYSAREQYDKALPLYQRALAIREQSLGPWSPDVAATLNNLAEVYKNQGRIDLAEPLYIRAIAIKEKAYGPDHPDLAISLNNLAGMYLAEKYFEQAEPLYERALSIREKRLGQKHPEVAQSLNNLASLYASEGKYDKALPMFERALAIRAAVLPADHPDLLLTVQNLAELYRILGRASDADGLLAQHNLRSSN